MANWNKLTPEDEANMNKMFEAGLTLKEISNRTGRAMTTVVRFKRKWRETKSMKEAPVIDHEESVVEPKTEEIQVGLNQSDYAKSYLADDPVRKTATLDVKRTIQVTSRKTGILYETDITDPEKMMQITFPSGEMIHLNIKQFEKFVDEGIDVFIEVTRKS